MKILKSGLNLFVGKCCCGCIIECSESELHIYYDGKDRTERKIYNFVSCPECSQQITLYRSDTKDYILIMNEIKKL